MKLHKQKVEVGHFQEQGIHTGSGLTYVELMKKHHYGYEFDGKTVPARRVLDVLGFRVKSYMSTQGKAHFLKWAKTSNTDSSRMLLLTGIGKDLRDIEKSIFGIPSQFIPSNAPLTIALKGDNSPMFDSGELMEATAYKTSLIDVAVTE